MGNRTSFRTKVSTSLYNHEGGTSFLCTTWGERWTNSLALPWLLSVCVGVDSRRGSTFNYKDSLILTSGEWESFNSHNLIDAFKTWQQYQDRKSTNHLKHTEKPNERREEFQKFLSPKLFTRSYTIESNDPALNLAKIVIIITNKDLFKGLEGRRKNVDELRDGIFSGTSCRGRLFGWNA